MFPLTDFVCKRRIGGTQVVESGPGQPFVNSDPCLQATYLDAETRNLLLGPYITMVPLDEGMVELDSLRLRSGCCGFRELKKARVGLEMDCPSGRLIYGRLPFTTRQVKETIQMFCRSGLVTVYTTLARYGAQCDHLSCPRYIRSRRYPK